MKLVPVLAAMVLVMTAAPSAQAVVRPTPMGPAPGSQIYFVASLQEADSMAFHPHRCGGVLIAPSWIITAKQCTEGRTLDSIAVRTGTPDLSTGGELMTVTSVVPHPTRDAALVGLSSRVDAVAVVIADEPVPVGTGAKVLGWGQTCPTRGCGGPSEKLVELDSVTDRGSSCAVEDGLICTRYSHGGGPCFGDEGGPLITGHGPDAWRLIGLVPAWRPDEADCTDRVPAFVDVTELRDWIRLHAGV